MELRQGSSPPEFREKIASTKPMVVEANSYKTRSTVKAEINGQTRLLHSVKGGFETGKPITGPVYEILFDPKTNEWIKIRAPKLKKEYGADLDKSADIMAASLRLAGFDDLADKVVKCTVKIDDKETHGFISPHIGPSLETMIKMYRESKKTMAQAEFIKFEESAKQFFSNAYTTALDHSIQLYLKHGYWTNDSNPGNILFRENDSGELKAITIDFIGKTQFRQIGVFEYVEQLHQSFKNHAFKHGIDFPFEAEAYRHLCSTERPGRQISSRRPLI